MQQSGNQPNSCSRFGGVSSQPALSIFHTLKMFRTTLTLARSYRSAPQPSRPPSISFKSLLTTPQTNRASHLVSLSFSTSLQSSPSAPRWYSTLRTSLMVPRHFPLLPRSPTNTFSLAEALGHTSFVLVALSYSIDDVLWLRLTAVVGSTAMLGFTYFHPHGKVLWLPFRWNALFIVINTAQIIRTLR